MCVCVCVEYKGVKSTDILLLFMQQNEKERRKKIRAHKSVKRVSVECNDQLGGE